MTSPSKFAHVVYNTHRYDEMISWYETVFGARVVHGDDKITFMTYDDEHHRFAFINLGPIPDPPPTPKMGQGHGINHVAYTWVGLDQFVELYARLKSHDIVPVRPIRHGPTLSMYYVDPDGNMMEFQIDLVGVEEAYDFMRSPAFEANPIGELFDPDELLAAHEAGEPLEPIVFRSDQEQVPVAR